MRYRYFVHNIVFSFVMYVRARTRVSLTEPTTEQKNRRSLAISLLMGIQFLAFIADVDDLIKRVATNALRIQFAGLSNQSPHDLQVKNIPKVVWNCYSFKKQISTDKNNERLSSIETLEEKKSSLD